MAKHAAVRKRILPSPQRRFQSSSRLGDETAAIFEQAVAAEPDILPIRRAGEAGVSGGDRVRRSDSDPSSTVLSSSGAVGGISSTGSVTLTEDCYGEKGVDYSAVRADQLVHDDYEKKRLELTWQSMTFFSI